MAGGQTILPVWPLSPPLEHDASSEKSPESAARARSRRITGGWTRRRRNARRASQCRREAERRRRGREAGFAPLLLCSSALFPRLPQYTNVPAIDAGWPPQARNALDSIRPPSAAQGLRSESAGGAV